MTDPLTINKMMPQPVPGSDVDVWAPAFNDVFGVTDNSFGGTATVALTNVPVVLSSGQYQCVFLNFTGALTGNVAVTLPPTGSFYTVINDTTNSSAFIVTLQTTVAGSRQIGVPPNITDIMTDGSNVRFRSLPYVGSYWNYTGSSTPAWVTACTVPPWLYCNGTSFSSQTYPSLTTILGSSQTPDLRGRTAAFLNDGTGRLTVVDGNTRLASGGGQIVTISQANLPAVNFPISDPGHTHSIAFNNAGARSGGAGGGSQFASNAGGAATITVQPSFTNIIVASGGSGTPIAFLPPGEVQGITLIRAG